MSMAAQGGVATASAQQALSGPISGSAPVLATFALGLGSFMNFLDMSIANVSVPTIAGDLGVSPTEGTWVITSYAVSEAIMLPLTGWLATRFGQVRLFDSATLLCTGATVACGLSVSFPMLIGARVMQGVVGASMIPLAQTLLTGYYPVQKRSFALGLWSMTSILGPMVGPLAGGWLTENLSWHWVFLINLPFGLLVAGLVWALFRDRESTRRRVPVDSVGLGLLVVGIGALQIVLDLGNELDWFGSRLIICLAAVASIALACFVAWELTDNHPIVDLRLFTRRNFAVGVTSLMLGAVAFFGTVVMLPLWLQNYQGYTALWAGKMLAFGGILPVILGPLVGANLNRIDARVVAAFGLLSFAVVAFWSARFTPDVDFWTVAATRFFMGLGISCFFLPIITISLSGLPVERIASASGISNFMRILGSSFGTAILTSTWEHKAILQHARLAESVSTYAPATQDYLLQLARLGLAPQAAFAQVDTVVTQQAYLMATNAVLCLCGILMVSIVLLVSLARPPFTIRGPGGH